jgi:hypothetical protein
MLKNGTLKASRKNNVKPSKADGHRAAIGVQRGKRWSEFSIDGEPSYECLLYWALGLFDASVGAAPTNPGTGAYQYAFQDLQNGLPTIHTPQTYSFQYGNSLGENSQFAFGAITGLNLKVGKSAVSYSTQGLASYPTKNITLTATPTIQPTNLINVTDCRFSYATAFSGLSTGKLLTGLDLELDIKNRFKQGFFIDDATTSVGGIFETQPDCTGKITVTEGSESDYFLGDLEASTPFYVQLLATGPLIVTGSPNIYNTFKWIMCAQVTEEQETEEDDLFAGMYSFNSYEDPTNGDINITCINTLATP